jgi:hypothetical protein
MHRRLTQRRVLKNFAFRLHDKVYRAEPDDRSKIYGWIGHNGNVMSYMAYPYYLPSERITLVVLLNGDVPASWVMMQDITRVVSPNHPWPGLPKQ